MSELTYEALLKRMCDKYEQESGIKPKDASDIKIRLQVLAGELYSMMNSLNWITQQAFPQTATGMGLELHAAERGITRKKAEKATGKLSFSRAQPLPYDVTVKRGTVCAVAGEELVEYETTESVVLKNGELSVTAPAMAVVGGENSNVAVGRINTLVTPPTGIETVTNTEPFSGGIDEESDNSLRDRLLRSYSILPNGTNAEFYRRAALEVDGVWSAAAIPRENGIGTVGVYIWGENGEPSQELINKVQNHLDALREVNVDVSVKAAERKQINVGVYITPAHGSTIEQARKKTEEAIREHFSRKQIGDATYRNVLGSIVINQESVENYSLAVNMIDYGAEKNKIHVLGTLNVMVMS